MRRTGTPRVSVLLRQVPNGADVKIELSIAPPKAPKK